MFLLVCHHLTSLNNQKCAKRSPLPGLPVVHLSFRSMIFLGDPQKQYPLGTPVEGICGQAAECNGCCIAPHLLPEAWVREIGGIDGDSPAVEEWGFSAKMPFEHAHKGWWQQGP